MFALPKKNVQLAVHSAKSGLPFLIHKKKLALVVLPYESITEINNIGLVFSEFDKAFLLVSSEKIKFHTRNEFLNGAIHKIATESEARSVLENPSSAKHWLNADMIHVGAIKIAKKAQVVPELLVFEKKFSSDEGLNEFASKNGLCRVNLTDVQNFLDICKIKLSSKAKIQLKCGVSAEFICYKSQASEHCAIVVGDLKNFKNPLVRIHSSCYTGDLFGSLACDCQDQLHNALECISQDSEGGIILHLMQEGRGIGLINKVKTYQLQSKGMDTAEANLSLGFDIDERDFAMARLILDDLGVKSVRLLTNNPRKVLQITKQGILVNKRVPMKIFKNKHNARYLQTKFEKLGHLL